MDTGIGERSRSLSAAESQEPGELAANDSGLLSDGDAGPHDRGRSDPDETRCNDESFSSSASVSGQHVSKKFKPKRWRIVSSSDEDADTLKDRFWRNLESGILPEDLCGDDLYSSVCQYFWLSILLCQTALF